MNAKQKIRREESSAVNHSGLPLLSQSALPLRSPRAAATVRRRKSVIRGLRYLVESILEYLAGGDSFEDVLTEFPDLEREDLQACMEFDRQRVVVVA